MHSQFIMEKKLNNIFYFLKVLGPAAVITVGANSNLEQNTETWDCWKSILHDESKEPSNGKLLKEIIQNSFIKDVVLQNNINDPLFPFIFLRNIWDEKFRMDYVLLPNNQIALHAERIK